MTSFHTDMTHSTTSSSSFASPTPSTTLFVESNPCLLDNVRIEKFQALIYPQLLIEEIPISERSKITVTVTREEVSKIIKGEDDRLIIIVGPCSIHDPHAAFEYARKLKPECQRYHNELRIVMRVYFEKPRTTIGWKGLINDPDLDGTCHVNKGLRIGRRLLGDITAMGVPVGCEYLDTMIPQYTADFVTWGAIGARTTECQLHRELASGLSMPVGFKNGTTGDIQIAVDACVSVKHQHAFLGITKQGLPAVCHSSGNPDGHLILRGSTNGPNYSAHHIAHATNLLKRYNCHPRVIVDCSHGNSEKDHRQQRLVCEDLCHQLSHGSHSIVGAMIESHLYEGSQTLPSLSKCGDSMDSEIRVKSFSMSQENKVLSQLRYGVSITDKCTGFPETLEMLSLLAEAVRKRRMRKANLKR